MRSLDPVSWPESRLGEALVELARRTGLADAGPPPPEPRAGRPVDQWIESETRRLGIDAAPLLLTYAAADEVLAAPEPLILHLADGGGDRFVVLASGGRRLVRILGPDHRYHDWALHEVAQAVRRPAEAPVEAEVDGVLDRAGLAAHRRSRPRAALLGARLGQQVVADGWMLGPAPGATVRRQSRWLRLDAWLAVLALANVLELGLWIASWWLIGRGALQGRLDTGWLVGWALLLASMVPFRLVATWAQGRVAVGFGGLLKRRLLAGALRIEPGELRRSGAGQLLGRVLESEAMESMAISGGFLTLLATIQLLFTVPILLVGPGGAVQLLLLAGWLAIVGAAAWRYARQRERWTASRTAMTHDLTEQMVGHRTRLAQQVPRLWHEDEDLALEAYLHTSRSMDAVWAIWLSRLPRGWLAVGLAGLAPSFVSGDTATSALAVGLGGVLLAYRAFEALVGGLGQLVQAGIVWRVVRPLFRAAGPRRSEASADRPAALAMELQASEDRDGAELLEAEGLAFHYPGFARPVLEDCTLRVRRGERILLEGPSGGGKSTLTAVLAGLYEPQSGLLLFRGYDRQSLGLDEWRRRVVLVPQFHENFVFTGTLAFNLLMGRRWPAREADLAEAEVVCRELGLAELLARMPAGLQQMVGESGWQLSHGERSRLFLARALLQGGEVVLVDESLGALDPETFDIGLRCIERRAPTVVLIAHP